MKKNINDMVSTVEAKGGDDNMEKRAYIDIVQGSAEIDEKKVKSISFLTQEQLESLDLTADREWTECEVGAWGKATASIEGYIVGDDMYLASEGVIYAPSDCGRLFNRFRHVDELVFKNFNTSETESMKGMFRDCGSLEEITLADWDTSKVKNMGSMFRDCKSLANINLSSFDMSNVISMNSMFRGCSSLKHIHADDWDVDGVKDMRHALEGCRRFTDDCWLDWEANDNARKDDMAKGCPDPYWEEVEADIEADRLERLYGTM